MSSAHKISALGLAKHDCKICQARKQKCDRLRPRCSNCQQDGKLCSGFTLQLSWQRGFSNERKPFRRRRIRRCSWQSLTRQTSEPYNFEFINEGPAASIDSVELSAAPPPTLEETHQSATFDEAPTSPNCSNDWPYGLSFSGQSPSWSERGRRNPLTALLTSEHRSPTPLTLVASNGSGSTKPDTTTNTPAPVGPGKPLDLTTASPSSFLYDSQFQRFELLFERCESAMNRPICTNKSKSTTNSA